MNKIWLFIAMSMLSSALFAQNQEDKIKSTGFPKFPKIINTDIPGAPILGQPVLISGTKQEIRTEKHGLAYPAFFDWNKDGKMDMLLGEFETGDTGSNIKVYLNQGTNKIPKYTGEYFYATDTKGDTLTAHQWCCIGTHSRFVDLDNDGYMDMLSGQYNPGKISWWRGSKNGFLPKQFVEQEGYIEGESPDMGNGDELDPKSNNYWNYSSAGFADFNGDGLIDLFVGGFRELRVALNTGTKNSPEFGLRKYLLGIDGQPLSVLRKPTKEDIERANKEYKYPHFSGVIKSFVNPVDWDGDGVLDLLVTHLYGNNKSNPVEFFRGVQTDKGLRFEDVKPLFTAQDAKKTFPGCQPNIMVIDYNQDGVPDLVFGISLPTVNGFEIDSLVAWSYVNDLKIESPGKDAGRALIYAGGIEGVKKKIEERPVEKQHYLGNLNDYKYLTLRHRGYVYVMSGSKNPVKAEAKKGVVAQDEVKRKVLNQTTKTGGGNTPVLFEVKSPETLRTAQEGVVEVCLNFKDGWYGYANTKDNIAMGLIPTKVEYQFPEGFELLGEPVVPEPQVKGTYQVYKGENVKFSRRFKINSSRYNNGIPSGEYTIGVILYYQTCNGDGCLPPVTEKTEMKIKFVRFGD